MKSHIKRTTVYLEDELHHALLIKSVETKHSISEMINESIRYSLAEDAIDYEAFATRKNEPSIPFENVLKQLKANGKI
jgi:hypothetical protein